MEFSLVICTYKRAQPLLRLLASVELQTRMPLEVLIIDGSPDDLTATALENHPLGQLFYFKVSPEDRGLTRQRNFGIAQVSKHSDVVCFLDDDTVLEPAYFENLMGTYVAYPEALAVGGYITNEVKWIFKGKDYVSTLKEFCYEGWCRGDGSRFILRKKLGLDSDVSPGCAPEFSHGRSIGFLPPSGEVYETQQLMGGVSSFRKKVFGTLQFSTYFEGYGLYEDADFTLRVSNVGKLYVNTKARLAHYHAPSGRPNQYEYGKMVVRNGFYVWRVKYPKPSIRAKYKWHAITFLLTLVRLTNIMTSSKVARKAAFTESMGRIAGWWSLLFNAPKVVL